ncbi:hypothetical protein NEIRO03_0579 [Nematocida sp. AWRm78]|nr:hypothetical protein NEIRO02_0556 [Nematocida sp. AWRm79]KAI5182944.1 hypothetical protein NEIRO03_0579 [Nematocida sp. AWRm78]
MQREETWETVQTKTFVNWINSKLEKGEARYKEESAAAPFSFKRVIDLKRDLQDGIVLHSLLYSATGSILRFNAKPVLVVHKRENIERIIEYLKQNGVEMINIGAADIQEGSIKLTLALIWRFIMAFSLREIRENGESIHERILKWCQRKTANYGVSIKDFGSSWVDGKALSALVHSDVGGFVFDDGEAKDISERALALAEEYLEVPALISADDLAKGVCDEKSLLTYLIEYYTASIKNGGKIKRKIAERAAQHATKGIMHAKEQLGALCALLQNEIPELEKAKKELDMRYTNVRMAEQNAIRTAVAYIIQYDILNRIKQPYTPTVISLPGFFTSIPVVGVSDCLSVRETLSGWNVSEGKEENNELQLFFDKIFDQIIEMSGCVTFLGTVELLKMIAVQIEEKISPKSKLSLDAFSFSSIETSRVIRERLEWVLFEVKDGIRRFNEAFSEEISREKAYICTPLSIEMQSISLPCPHKNEWALIGGRDAYVRILSESMPAAGAKEFTPIAPESEK